LRATASKASELGDHEKALTQLARAEDLCEERLGTKDHSEFLFLLLLKVEVLMKFHRIGTPEVQQKAVDVAEQAVKLAKKLYGEHTITSN